MNDKQFKDLLNLYIDNEITPNEREIFEREIAVNSARRALYEEYAWMQRASEVVLKRFEGEVEEQQSPHMDQCTAPSDLPVETKKVRGDWRLLYGAAALFMIGGTLFLTLSQIANPPLNRATYDIETAHTAVELAEKPSEQLPESQLLPEASAYRPKVHPILPSDDFLFSWAEGGETFDFSLRTPIEPVNDSPVNNRVYSSRTFFESPSPDMASFVFRR